MRDKLSDPWLTEDMWYRVALINDHGWGKIVLVTDSWDEREYPQRADWIKWLSERVYPKIGSRPTKRVR